MELLPPMMSKTSLKFIVLGDKFVGKTTLINALQDEDSSTSFTMGTVSSDLVRYELHTSDYGNVVLNIWDTVGEDYTDVITSNIFRGANGIIIIYDVTNRESFKRVTDRWLPRIRSQMGDGGLGDDTNNEEIMSRDNIFKILIVANKVDILGERRKVTREEAQELTNTYKLPFIQLSTISDHHETIKLPFLLLTSMLMPFFMVSPRRTSSMNLNGANTPRDRDDSTTCC